MGKGNGYTEPKVETIAKETPAEDAKVVVPASTTAVNASENVLPTDEPCVVKVADMLNFKETATSDYYNSAVARYIQVLLGKISPKDRDFGTEQLAWLRTLENVLLLDFDKFTLVIDYTLEQFAKNKECLSLIKIFSLNPYLIRKGVAQSSIDRYEALVSALRALALNGSNRQAVSSMVDLNSLCAMFGTKQAENINTYFINAFSQHS